MKQFSCLHADRELLVLAEDADRARNIAASFFGCRGLEVVAYEK